MTRIALFGFLAFLITSCGDRALESSRIYPAGNIWTYSDTLDLSFDISDTTDIYDLSLTVEHSEDYPWENLYVKVHNVFPDNDTLSRPVSLELADRRGQWQGDCSGSMCEAVIDLQRSVYFPQTGRYQIWVEQFMRQDSIPGIKSVKISLNKAERPD